MAISYPKVFKDRAAAAQADVVRKMPDSTGPYWNVFKPTEEFHTKLVDEDQFQRATEAKDQQILHNRLRQEVRGSVDLHLRELARTATGE